MTPLKALSIRQPWCHHILCNGKDIENRTWPTKFRGQVLIHASKTFDGPAAERRNFVSTFDHGVECTDMGGIVGVMDIVDCVEHSDSEWFHGPYGFVIANARPLPFIPCHGALGFFNLPLNIRGLVRLALEDLLEGRAA